jgi:hypothetical protein
VGSAEVDLERCVVLRVVFRNFRVMVVSVFLNMFDMQSIANMMVICHRFHDDAGPLTEVTALQPKHLCTRHGQNGQQEAGCAEQRHDRGKMRAGFEQFK